MYNREGYYKVIRKINEKLREHHHHRLIAVEIYGKLTYLHEAEIRALQVIMAKSTDDEFKELSNNIVVYNRARKRGSGTMTFQRNGCFKEDFEPGFYDVCTNLAFEII